jgi:hypothetical protein
MNIVQGILILDMITFVFIICIIFDGLNNKSNEQKYINRKLMMF